MIAPPPAAHLKLPPGSEIMPCTVPACEGTWVWSPGMQLRPAAEGEPAVDRMCDSCRGKHDEPARDPRPALALAHAESSEDGNAASVPAETPHDVVADGGLELSEDDLSDRDHATDDHAQAVHEVDYDAHHDDEGASSEDGAEPATSPQDGPHGDPEPSATPEATAGDDEPSTDS